MLDLDTDDLQCPNSECGNKKVEIQKSNLDRDEVDLKCLECGCVFRERLLNSGKIKIIKEDEDAREGD